MIENSLDKFVISEAKNEVTFFEINHLAERVGWGKNYYRNKQQWEKVLSLSSYVAYIKKSNKLIAFGRITDDEQMCMFYDICVHPDYQKQYIGSLLMNFLIDKIKDKNHISIGLFIWQGNLAAAEFYRKFGFEVAPAMELKKYMRSI